ncbi:MAG: molybdopterin-dependent oxidoreductase [Ignavibacteriales bacterium]|nr:molybdopterin-dependent oxidoreductase [Ignavibacteriales bacterium]
MKNDNYLDLDFKDIKIPFEVDRREFIKLLGGGLFILFTVGDTLGYVQQEQRRRGELPTDFNAFLRIDEQGRTSCFTGKIEMGQGIITSLAQMLADELDVTLDSVQMIMGDTDLCPWDMGTFGSMSTRFFGPPLRAAAAEARNVLLELASEQLKIPVDKLSVEEGVIYQKLNRKKNISYAELTKGKKIERHLKGKPKIKDPSEFKIMNKSITRVDAIEKVTGKAKFAGDMQFPDMLYAKVLRPPAHGAKLIDVDLSEVKKMNDVVVVQDGDLVAVLHKYPDVAEKALEKIKAKFSPSESKLNNENIYEHLMQVAGDGKVVSHNGDINQGEKQSATVIDETYYDSYVAHSPIEPHTAVAKMDGNKVTVWASTQNPFTAKEEVARALGVASENVRIITPYVGGGFGGKTRNLQIVDAARLAKLTGKPVMVAYSRKEEFFYDAFHPAAIVKVRSGLTSSNDISFWDYNVYFAGERGATHFYNIQNSNTKSYSGNRNSLVQNHPFATGAWRAPGNNTNTFARECQIDIMAAKAGVDPLEFRMKNLTDKKMIEVLKVAGEKFGWKSFSKNPSGKGFGIACGIDAGSYVAMIVEVDVNSKNGNVKVNRVVCAQNMGLVINPEGATIQMEGCIMMGLGYALTEEIKFSNGEILNKNYDTYEIPKFSWLPKIETVILDKKNEPPQGGGEPAIITVGAAIGNAIYDKLGIRLNRMPMTPERIKDAIAKKS